MFQFCYKDEKSCENQIDIRLYTENIAPNLITNVVNEKK